jgi:hypothetical protein
MTWPTQSHNIGIVAVATVCPKCASDRPVGADSCPRCGLLVSRWSNFARPEIHHPVLDTLWARVEAEWSDEGRHARFLDQAAVLGALDVAAARYRSRLARLAEGRDEGERSRAQAGLDRAVRLALQLQGVQAPDPAIASAGRLVKIAGLFIALVLFVTTLWVVWAMLSRR